MSLAYDDCGFNVWATGGLDLINRKTPSTNVFVLDLKNLTFNRNSIAS